RKDRGGLRAQALLHPKTDRLQSLRSKVRAASRIHDFNGAIENVQPSSYVAHHQIAMNQSVGNCFRNNYPMIIRARDDRCFLSLVRKASWPRVPQVAVTLHESQC